MSAPAPIRTICSVIGIGLLAAGAAYSPQATAQGSTTAPLLHWETPESFDRSIAGLGLPQLPDVENHTLYAPSRSHSAIELGGDGNYESTLHGTYNHHTQVVRYGNHVIVYWTNHANDENGPGQRMLARWGTISEDGNRIDWGSPESNTIELVPAPAPVRRREPLDEVKDRRYVEGHLRVIDGQLVSSGKVAIYHGWTDDLKYRTPLAPIPPEHFSQLRNNAKGYSYDMRWATGPNYYQLWDFKDGQLVPTSPLYIDRKPAKSIQLTPSESLELGPLSDTFENAPTLAEASPALRTLLTSRPAPTPGQERRPGYAPNTRHLAANGKHGLAHMAQYRRPDGAYVMIRDNLADPDYYFAAQAHPGESFPPAIATNMYGFAMPAAGELPDGTCWILGNSEGRFDFYIMLSEDGRTFDRTWAVNHDASYWDRGLFKPSTSGPQYPYGLPIGDALWIFYSVGKEQIAVTRLPFSALLRKETTLAADNFTQWHSTATRTAAASLSVSAAANAAENDSIRVTETSLSLLPGLSDNTLQTTFPATALGKTGDMLRVRLQFESAFSPRQGGDGLRIGLYSAVGGYGAQATLIPVTEEGPATLALTAHGTDGQTRRSTEAPFERKIASRQKYDAELTLERAGEGISAQIRIFGGRMPAAVQTGTTFSCPANTGFDIVSLDLSGRSFPDLTLTHFAVTKSALPTDGIGSNTAYEARSTKDTELIHIKMADH